MLRAILADNLILTRAAAVRPRAFVFLHVNGGGFEAIQVDAACLVEAPETQYSSWAGLDAGGAANAFRVFHGQPLIGEIHDVDPLMANRGADIAGNTFFLVGKNAKARESGVNMHQCRQRTGKSTPDASR